MKRVVLSLIGIGCLLAAAVAFSQTSVLVAQKESEKSNDGPGPIKGFCDKICRDWPVYFDGDNALFFCDEWPDFAPGQPGAEDCNDDPEAAYAYFSSTDAYPCDCSASSGDLACDCARNEDEPEKKTKKKLADKKFGPLSEGKHSPDTDLMLLVTEKDVTTNSGCIFKCTAQVLPMIPKYTYINATVPKKVGGVPETTLKAIVYLVEVHRTNCTGKPIKKFWLAFECTEFPGDAHPSPINLDIARHDQRTEAPYYAFTGKFNGKPILLLTETGSK